MPVLNSLALAMLQGSTDAFSAHDVHLIMIFMAVIMVALVGQAVGVFIAGAFAAKLFHKVEKLGESFDEKAAPILQKSSELLNELAPKVRSISENVDQMSYTMRAKVDEIGETVSQINRTVQDVNERSKMQVSRVNGIVTEALDATEDISRTVQQGIRVPVRQVMGIIAGVKAGLETLLEKSPFGKSKGDGRYDL